MGLEKQLGDDFEGLGRNFHENRFTIIDIEGDIAFTDNLPESFDRRKYAPFHFLLGDEYSRDLYEGGELLASKRTGLAYLLIREKEPILVEGDKKDFLKKVEEIGYRNKCNRLLKEDKLIASGRTHYSDEQMVLLDVAIAAENDNNPRGFTVPFEAYSVLVNLQTREARIAEAEYQGGPLGFYEKRKLRDVPTVLLPENVFSDATTVPHSGEFRKLTKDSMIFIRENCYRG
ncbi:hypothetical protein HY638_00900 [Candidatus Woesearchaeota archaeon]|nr:hypothetical protein [Candidatus Woesearchaeota archaeon]